LREEGAGGEVYELKEMKLMAGRHELLFWFTLNEGKRTKRYVEMQKQLRNCKRIRSIQQIVTSWQDKIQRREEKNKSRRHHPMSSQDEKPKDIALMRQYVTITSCVRKHNDHFLLLYDFESTPTVFFQKGLVTDSEPY
jgi:hypothetical protein